MIIAKIEGGVVVQINRDFHLADGESLPTGWQQAGLDVVPGYLLEDGALVAPRFHPTGLDVDSEADRRIEAGSSFTVSWQAAPIPMTGRQKDQSAILGLFGKAQLLKVAGVTSADMVFRDADNHNHTLTPDQMLELCGLGMGWIELVRRSAWTLKDDAKAAGTPIPADYADDKHWPS